MNTLFTIGMLVVYAIIPIFFGHFLLNIAGFPGSLLAGQPEKRSKAQFIFGSIVSAIGQLYLYLAYTAFIVGWTTVAASRDDVVGFIVWPIAFISVFVPIWFILGKARTEANEMKHASAQSEAIHLTFLGSVVGFFVFAFIPIIPKTLWGWVPYV